MIFKTLLLAGLSFVTACASRKPTLTPSTPIQTDTLVRGDTFLPDLFRQYPQYFDSILQHNDQWKIQVIYTQIDRDANNHPVFTHHFFNTDGAPYFYPASTVKMPIAVLALQRLNELNIPGVNKFTTMITGAGYPGQTAVANDPTTADGRPTVAHYIKKIFLVSDNDACNRLYEFLGQEYINSTLHRMGYDSLQIIHRLNISLSEEQNRHTNPVAFYGHNAQILHSQPLVRSNLAYQPRQTFLGNGYYAGGQLVRQPFDFSKKNRVSLPDLHNILQSILFPETVPLKQRFNLKPDDYAFLYRYMSMKPRESDFPSYDSSYTDAYSKLLLYGGRGEMDPGVRIFNKEGDAYGFLTDVAYVTDTVHHVEFMLSATIACNSDGIFNDDHYDYDTVGFPFLKHLGRVIYDHELSRKKRYPPDMSIFKINYGK